LLLAHLLPFYGEWLCDHAMVFYKTLFDVLNIPKTNVLDELKIFAFSTGEEICTYSVKDLIISNTLSPLCC